MKHSAILLLICLMQLPLTSNAQLLMQHRDVWFNGGAVCRDTDTYADLSFQLSAKIRPIEMGRGWSGYIGYTQISIWDAFNESSPFHDNLYNPGIYFKKELTKSTLTLGLEHLSNGRPYFGNKLANDNFDDLSRGMNYALVQMSIRTTDKLSVSIFAKAGCGCGVGSYERHEKLFTQDLFLNYLGYVTLSGRYTGKHICSSISITPLLNKSIANATADLSWTFNEHFPALFLQAHYGFDQSLCDCVPDKTPPASVRFGIVLRNN